MSTLRERIRDWGDAGQVFANSGWLVVENLARMVLALAVSIALTKALGRGQYGTLRTAMAFVALCSSFTNLGLAGIVVRELATRPEDAPKVMGSTSILYVLGSLVSVAVCVAVGLARAGDDTLMLGLILIFTLGVLFHAPRVYEMWFQYKVASKFVVYAKGIPSIASAIALIVACTLDADIIVIAAIIVADTVMSGLALTALGAFKKDIPKTLRFSGKEAKFLLSQSWPLIAAKVAVVTYLKIDQVMIDAMLGSERAGVYAAAVDISEVWYFIPSAIAASAFSGLITKYKEDREQYEVRMQDLIDLMFILAIIVVTFVLLVAGPLIRGFYDPEFNDAIGILRIHIFAAPFIFMGYGLSKAIITEGFLKFSLLRHVAGALVNIGLNLLLIPRMGGYGAAWATVISYAIASYFICVIHPDARRTMAKMTKSILMPLRLLRPNRNG